MSRIDLEGRVALTIPVTDGVGLAAAERVADSSDQAVLRDADGSAIKSAHAKFETKARGRTVVLIDKTSVDAATVVAKESRRQGRSNGTGSAEPQARVTDALRRSSRFT